MEINTNNNYDILIHCPHCGTMYLCKWAINGYTTDFNDSLKIIQGGQLKCLKCQNMINARDDRIIGEEWINRLFFIVKGN